MDLTADVLTRPMGQDPMVAVIAELADHYCAQETGTIDFSESRVRVGMYHSVVDPRPYIPAIGDHPLSLHFRQTHDVHVATLADADRFARSPRSQAILRDLRAEGLEDFVYLPMRARSAMEHRWLGLSSARLGNSVRDELEVLLRLIRAIDAQSAVLAECFDAPVDPGSAAAVGLSARELAVLGLVARGFTAVAIAYRLHVSPRTIGKHQEHIYRKLDVRDRLAAVLRGQELGIIPRARSIPGPDAVRYLEAELRHDS